MRHESAVPPVPLVVSPLCEPPSRCSGSREMGRESETLACRFRWSLRPGLSTEAPWLRRGLLIAWPAGTSLQRFYARGRPKKRT